MTKTLEEAKPSLEEMLEHLTLHYKDVRFQCNYDNTFQVSLPCDNSRNRSYSEAFNSVLEAVAELYSRRTPPPTAAELLERAGNLITHVPLKSVEKWQADFKRWRESERARK